MRSAIGIFGAVCGLIAFGAIAAGGFFGHAVAVRLRRISMLASIAMVS
jgi:hypothetical protein